MIHIERTRKPEELTDDEDKKIEEAKRTFELKTFISKLFQRTKQEKEIDKDAH